MLKSPDKIYQYSLSLDGSRAKLLSTTDFPWDPKDGWKQSVCGSAPAQVVHGIGGEKCSSDKDCPASYCMNGAGKQKPYTCHGAGVKGIIFPVNGIDGNPQDMGDLPSLVHLDPQKKALRRTRLPTGGGNAVGMTLAQVDAKDVLMVSTYTGALLSLIHI